MEKVRVGVIGAGYFGRFHIEKYLRLEGVELVGVVDIDPARRQEIARRYSVRTFSHHAQLFGRVESVSIAVPTSLHHEIAKDCLLRGIHVLVEKPIASTLEEADELIELAEGRRLVLQVGHQERFNAAFQAAEGRIKDPFLIEFHRLGPFTGRGGDVDVVLDLMVHDLDILLRLIRSRVRDLKARGVSVLTPHFDEAHAQIEFENGCRARLTACRTSKDRVRNVMIYQPDGVLIVDFQNQTALFSKEAAGASVESLNPGQAECLPVKKVDPLEEEIRSFLQSVRERKKALVSGSEGRRVLEMALAILQKMREGLTAQCPPRKS
ncbi:MAG: Gfo/Idh/MocA family oxidoreductase [Desulfobacterota bacterium]|nr:Gfo/Idh/MocA family oxidoreductase [Thermodesulfobacteriota bacterium]